MFLFEQGIEVKDKVTGFKGIITSRIEYINGCIQYGVVPTVGKEKDKVPEVNYIDEGRIVKIGNGVNKKIKSRPTGGLMRDAPKH